MKFLSDKKPTKTYKMSTNNNIYDTKDSLKENASKKMSITFTGCGLLGLYYIGVISCLRKYLPKCKDAIVCGASSGALAALTLCLDLPIESSTSKLIELAIKARNKSLGMLDPAIDMNKMLYDYLKEVLPEDCHKRATGRLYLSVTRVCDGKNVFLNQFDSKEDVIRALQCSCFIPVVSGIVPLKYRGISYIDGAFSNNMPKIDGNTITVSPYGGSDICPKEDRGFAFNFTFYDNLMPLSLSNFCRLFKIAFPGNPCQFTNLCYQGFDDTLRFLLRKNKILCISCMSTQLSSDLNFNKAIKSHINEVEDLLIKAQEFSKLRDYGRVDCVECQKRRKLAEKDSLPNHVIQTIEGMCSQCDKRVKSWFSRNSPYEWVSTLRKLLQIPIDFTFIMLYRIWKQLSLIRTEHKNTFDSLVIFTRSFATLGKFKYQ